MAKIVRVVFEGSIPNFRSICDKSTGENEREVIKMPTFNIPSTKIEGCLKVYPSGINEKYKDYVSVFLELTNDEEDSSGDLISTFDVWIPEVKGSKKNSGIVVFCLDERFGYPDYIERDYLLDSKNGILVDDEDLHFGCEINVSVIIASLDNEKKYKFVKKMSFEEIGPTEELFSTDVTFKIRDQRFKAHKLILMARSEKFKKMFTKQSDKTEFEIDNVSVELMNDLLRYIYTGEVNVLGLKLIDFWKIVCIYRLENSILQDWCEKKLIAEISEENVVELLEFSFDCSFNELRDKCLNYIDEHWRQIFRQACYKKLKKSRPTVAQLIPDYISDSFLKNLSLIRKKKLLKEISS